MQLRKIDMADNFLLRTWRNDNAQYFPPGEYISSSMQADWYRRYLETPHDHQYMVCLGPWPGSRPVGTVAIDVRSKMIGRVMRGRSEGHGAMSAALAELMDLYGEGTYTLQVLDGNEHAVAFYLKCGFHVFGRQAVHGVPMINMRKESS